MTEIIFAVIDNHKKYKKTCYDMLFKTKRYSEFVEYVKNKGLSE